MYFCYSLSRSHGTLLMPNTLLLHHPRKLLQFNFRLIFGLFQAFHDHRRNSFQLNHHFLHRPPILPQHLPRLIDTPLHYPIPYLHKINLHPNRIQHRKPRLRIQILHQRQTNPRPKPPVLSVLPDRPLHRH